MLRRAFGLDDVDGNGWTTLAPGAAQKGMSGGEKLLAEVAFPAAGGLCGLPKGMARLMHTGFLAGPAGHDILQQAQLRGRHRTVFHGNKPTTESDDSSGREDTTHTDVPSVSGDVHHDQRFSRSYTYTNIDGKMDVQETETRCKDGNCQTIARHMVPDAPEKGDKETKLVLVEPPGVETRKQVVLMSPSGAMVPSGGTPTVTTENVSMPGQRVMYMTNSSSG
mmetsp:Transcript_11242/g.25620  ORF Transcript_11242/g.25620 Transcript_11242/m.25620 type:complete len:222 (+) Transcript_11242:109-774(+)